MLNNLEKLKATIFQNSATGVHPYEKKLPITLEKQKVLMQSFITFIKWSFPGVKCTY